MLRLLLLLLYLAASYASGPAQSGGGLDPNGLKTQAPPPTTNGDIGGGLDPDGRKVQPHVDLHGNLDPNG
jgi:hypothetical protein